MHGNINVKFFHVWNGIPYARPTSGCILFDGENISFDASPVLYIYKQY